MEDNKTSLQSGGIEQILTQLTIGVSLLSRLGKILKEE